MIFPDEETQEGSAQAGNGFTESPAGYEIARAHSPSEFLLLTPLPNWKAGEQGIAGSVVIRRLLPLEKEALEASDTLFSHHDIGEPARAAHWLCYEFENPYAPDNVRYRRRQEAAFKLVLHAMYAVQILVPVGGTSMYLLYRKTDAGLILDSTERRQALIETSWARVCEVPTSFPEDIPRVFEGVREAFQKPTLRLQIPVWLFEQGMSAPDRHIRILLWATGLDGLTRSGGIVAFAERLSSLLGADTLIFPPDGAGRRPKYRVADVVEDLYELRNEMAHGLPFQEKFRKKRGFLAEDGQPVLAELANCRHDQALEECAGFLLCKALREVFLRNCYFDPQIMDWREQS